MKKTTSKSRKKNEVFPSGEVMSMLEQMNEGISVIAETQGQVFKRLDGIDGRLDGIDGRLDRIQEDVTDIKFKLDGKADKSDFFKLEKRVTKLERTIQAGAK